MVTVEQIQSEIKALPYQDYLRLLEWIESLRMNTNTISSKNPTDLITFIDSLPQATHSSEEINTALHHLRNEWD